MPHATDIKIRQRRQFMSLQAARGIAAMMVVVLHVEILLVNAPGLWRYQIRYENFDSLGLGVEMFFVLSGMVILSAHWDELGRPARIPSFLWKRFRRIYPIYWIVLTLTLLKHHFEPGAATDPLRSPFVILSSFLLVHIHSVVTNLVVGWTLFHEVMFYGVFVVLLLDKRVGAVAFASWLLASLFFLHAGNPYWDTIFSPLHWLFAFGMVACFLLRKERVPYPVPAVLAGSAIFLACVILPFGFIHFGMAVKLTAGFGALLLLVGAAELVRRGHFAVPKWLSFLGDASYSIYLIHFMAVSTAAKLFFRLESRLHVRLPIAFWMVLLFAVGTAFGCLVYIGIERPILRWLGSRPKRPAIQAA